MEPRAAAKVLRTSLKQPSKPLTIADAAAQSGLALRDAERGMHWLTNEYRGQLRVTNDGDLLFRFPHGFTKPWVVRDGTTRALGAIGRGAAGVLRFVVRAWLTIVLVAYVGIFVGLLIALMFARSNDNSSNRGGNFSGVAYGLFRVLGDALFWTFHPFSPMYIGGRSWEGRAQRTRGDETPFYEKVNRFFFGPVPARHDPRAMEKKIVALIRAQKGRIGLADVMRVTGLPREQADPMMARLMLDYDGDVEVSEAGGITYKFENIRKTAESGKRERVPPPAWTEPVRVPAFTGNTPGSNFLIGALNGFNLLMSLYALDANLTISRLVHLFDRVPGKAVIDTGTPIALGLVPLVFSLLLFLIPLGRAAVRPLARRKAAKENARLAMLREVLTRVQAKVPLTDDALVQAARNATGEAPSEREVARTVAELGGDVDLENAGEKVRYRFAELETEREALEVEREAARDDEAKVGPVVFATERVN
jgi:hypothetical protein